MASRKPTAVDKRDETLELEAGPWGIDGLTRTRLPDGLEVRLHNAIPGERHRVQINHRSHGGPVAWAHSLEILEDGKAKGLRRTPPCPIHKECGACGIQHAIDDDQLRLKVESASSILPPSLLNAVTPPPKWPSSTPTLGYRHKAVFLLAIEQGKLLLGGFRRRSHDVIDLEGCPVLAPSLVTAERELRNILSSLLLSKPHRISRPGGGTVPSTEGSVRSIIARANRKGEVLLCVVVSAPQALSWLEPALCGLVESTGPIVGCSTQVFQSTSDAVAGPDPATTVAGVHAIDERVGSIDLCVQPLSFFQVNPFALELLVDLIQELVRPPHDGPLNVLDLYCGGGSLGLSLASSCPTEVHLTGIDIDSRAIETARDDALRATVDALFVAGPAATSLPALVEERGPFDVVLVDPPRRGLRREAIEELRAIQAEKLLYVSCHGPSLARDSELLAELGYVPEVLTPLDMLPQTAHLEWIALFAREV
jgi:23S rRNA (uracil-5-)-methyltransferase RumA